MGGSGSSSKRKSSKKKSLKTSSQKKKSRRKDSKKRRHDYDSISSYSDDESLNSKRTSSSTSKSDYKRKTNKHKKLRRTRDHSVSSYSDDHSINSDSLSTYDNGYKSKKKARLSRIKSTKKRTKKRHDSPDTDAKAHNMKKMKDRVVKPRKKSLKKKKSKKQLSSSSNSDSESSSSSSADRKRKRSKVTLDKEIERPRGRESYKTYKKHKTRSPSCSSRDRGSDHSVGVDHSDGALAPVNNSRRLRSVITFVDQPHDESENKEEIVYDYDDYPSPKSMDSNEGGNKRESDNHSHDAFDEKIRVENVLGEELPELGQSGVDEDDQNNVHINKFEKEKEDLGGDDLELILRQKALENLRKFRGGIQTGPRSSANLKMNNENDVNGSSPGKVDIIQNKSANQSSSSAREMNQSSGLTLERDSSPLVDIKKQTNNEHIEQEPGVAIETSDHPPDGRAILGFSEEDKGTAKHIRGSDASPGAGAINACSSSTAKPTSSVVPISGEQSVEEQQNEAKDGSEFKQKTMSVMRGGEMVQVSYKVYIPKKAPALARRQLRR